MFQSTAPYLANECHYPDNHGMKIQHILISLFLFSTNLHAIDEIDIAKDYLSKQLNSLNYVFYRFNPRPPQPSSEELEQVTDLMANGADHEIQFLKRLYGDNKELWAYAIRDTDNDGIKDFKISGYYGKFHEGDTDLDGDGIINNLDPNPYAPTEEVAPDSDGDGIPDTVDWTGRRPLKMVSQQAILFKQHNILLVDRDAHFSPELVQAVFDLIRTVYAIPLRKKQTLTNLKTIAMESNSILNPEDEEGSGDYAQVIPSSHSMVLYKNTLDASPIVQLGTLIHEMDHVFQYLYDYDEEGAKLMATLNAYPSTKFYKEMEQFGWEAKIDKNFNDQTFRSFTTMYASPDNHSYTFKGEPLQDWVTWSEEIFAEVGDDYLEDERITDAKVIGDYSLSNPFEWRSDHVLAYSYAKMAEQLTLSCKNSKKILRQLDHVLKKDWQYFRYQNIDRELFAYFDNFFQHPDEVYFALAQQYILGPLKLECHRKN